MKGLFKKLAGGLLALGAAAIPAVAHAAETVKIGVLHSLSGTMAISETSLRDVVLMALYLAGKLPVVLNWTTGEFNLAHAAKVMGLGEVAACDLPVVHGLKHVAKLRHICQQCPHLSHLCTSNHYGVTVAITVTLHSHGRITRSVAAADGQRPLEGERVHVDKV